MRFDAAASGEVGMIFWAHQLGHTVDESTAEPPAEFRHSLYRYAGRALVFLVALGGLLGGK